MTVNTKSALRSLHDASLAAGDLDVTSEELIAFACGMTRRCEERPS